MEPNNLYPAYKIQTTDSIFALSEKCVLFRIWLSIYLRASREALLQEEFSVDPVTQLSILLFTIKKSQSVL